VTPTLLTTRKLGTGIVAIKGPTKDDPVAHDEVE
jgi:hypothetical protein